MMVISLLGALGVLLVFDGLTRRGDASGWRALARADSWVQEAAIGSLTAARLLALSLVAGAVGALGIAGLTASLVPAVAVGLCCAYLPPAMVAARRRRRRRRFREAWPDAISAMVAAVRAGMSLPEVCVEVAERGPKDLQGAFGAFASAYRASGRFSESLERLRSHAADPIADRVVVALRLANEVGGTDLVRVLRALGDLVRQDLQTRREIEARWSWTVTAARLAAAAPWIVLVVMATRPEAASVYDSTAGIATIGAGLVATVIGYRLMLRAGSLPDDRRLGR